MNKELMKLNIDKYKEFEEPSLFGPPNYSGVYGVFLYRNMVPEILYIGSSKNIKKRVSSSSHFYLQLFEKHQEDGDLIVTRSFPCSNYKELEIVLIKKYKPILNKTHNN